MNAVAEGLDDLFNPGRKMGEPKKIGFVLLTFEFGNCDDGRVNYIGNGLREDVHVALKELLARWEGMDPVEPGHG